ncbi:uncharacterized protein LOC110726589 [Chenopodium quinoa]|uniref:uncharacterized protein LOC110726589 n=1 Tax=Chenopodium quinoa TaxID=63459 RepID=UPI000B771B02|nr:uncharacterized protein LOC110726589 [Chenopodium quinoa]
MELLALKPCMTYNDLLKKVYTITGSNPTNVELDIKMRLSVSGIQILPVLNDDHLEVLRGVIAMRSLPTDLYVEMVPICTQQTIRLTEQQPTYHPSYSTSSLQMPSYNIPSFEYGMGSFSRMLHDDQFDIPFSSHFTAPELSVLDMYEDTNDEGEGGDEEDVINNELSDDDAVARTPLPWFTQINENYEVDMYWDDSGSQTSFVVGGEFEKGMIFDSKKVLREIVKLHSMQRKQFYTTVTSNENVLHLQCKRKCGWSLRGTKTNLNTHAFKIVSYKGPHRENCKDPCLRVEFIQDLISNKFHFDVPYRKASYAKQKAIAAIFWDWESSYNILPFFMQALQESNPGTVVLWKYKAIAEGIYYSNMEVFERVFWAFKPCIDGFKHCMPILSISGTH